MSKADQTPEEPEQESSTGLWFYDEQGRKTEPDERTVDERKFDDQLDTMRAWWWTGHRASDWVAWYDDGMGGMENDREWRSGCEGLEGDALRDAMLTKDDTELGWALGLSRDIETVSFDELDRAGADPRFDRFIFDHEREVFVLAGEPGIRVAPLKVVWDRPSTAARVIELGPPIPWTTGREMRKAIDQVVLGRRKSYKPCISCGKPAPPEGREETPEGPECHSCMEGRGVVF